MLRIFDLLKIFFEDVYRTVSVREYAKLTGMSPPTASKTLKEFSQENLLIMKKQGIYLFFRANRDGFTFKGLSRLYWHKLLHDATEDIHKKILYRKIILFGSISKVENTIDSDIDLYLDINKKNIDTKAIEKKLKRKIQLHFKENMKNIHLKKNIENGIIIR